MADCRGFEPLISAVTGQRIEPDYANNPLIRPVCVYMVNWGPWEGTLPKYKTLTP